MSFERDEKCSHAVASYDCLACVYEQNWREAEAENDRLRATIARLREDIADLSRPPSGRVQTVMVQEGQRLPNGILRGGWKLRNGVVHLIVEDVG